MMITHVKVIAFTFESPHHRASMQPALLLGISLRVVALVTL
jgi:hypothetical protein